MRINQINQRVDGVGRGRLAMSLNNKVTTPSSDEKSKKRFSRFFYLRYWKSLFNCRVVLVNRYSNTDIQALVDMGYWVVLTDNTEGVRILDKPKKDKDKTNKKGVI